MILALDCGFRATGWAVLSGGQVKDLGCIRTQPTAKKRGVRKADSDMECCALLVRELMQIVTTFGVRGVVCELPTAGAKGARANRCMGMASAVVATVVEVGRLAAEWVQPGEVKAVAGVPNASKADVERAVRARWPELVLPELACEREHVADALGAYMAAEHGQLVRMCG